MQNQQPLHQCCCQTQPCINTHDRICSNYHSGRNHSKISEWQLASTIPDNLLLSTYLRNATHAALATLRSTTDVNSSITESLCSFLAKLARNCSPLDRKSTRLNSSHANISYA